MKDTDLRGPRFRRLLGTVYISTSAPDLGYFRTTAALLVHPPGAIASHASAARLYGAPVPHDADEHVTVAEAKDRRQRHGIRCHATEVLESDVRIVQGLRVSSPARLFIELAGGTSLVDLVVLGDWLVKNGHVTLLELRGACRASRLQQAGRASAAARFVREGVESPMETRTRLLIVLAGLPEPTINHELTDERGAVLVRVDLSYEFAKLAIEYDGRQHLRSTSQWERDVVRRDVFSSRAWTLITVTARGIYDEPEDTLNRIVAALRLAGISVGELDDTWRAHFPCRTRR